MEKKENNNKKSLLWLLVVNDKKEASTDTIEATLEGYQALLLNYSEYRYVFTIIHNKDTKKRTHLHAVIELYEKATRKAILDTLEGLLNIDREQLSIEPTNSPILGVQYLTHKNQPEKEPYKYEEIRTNNAEELERRFGAGYIDPEKQQKEVLFGSHTMADLLKHFSLMEAKQNLAVWKEIQKEKGYDKDSLIAQNEGMRKDYRLLYDFTNKLLDFIYKQPLNSLAKSELDRLKATFDEFLPF